MEGLRAAGTEDVGLVVLREGLVGDYFSSGSRRKSGFVNEG